MPLFTARHLGNCAIQNKRRGFLSKSVVFLHDNARPHTANVTKTLLRGFGWDVLYHPPYSPDLAPSDFHLFLHLKSFLADKHFNNDKELKENVSNWLKTQAATFYEEGIQKLVPLYDTCLQNFGSYVESPRNCKVLPKWPVRSFGSAAPDLDDATRWRIVGKLEVGHSLAMALRTSGFREMWRPLCQNSSQRQEQLSADLVKAAKGQQRLLKTITVAQRLNASALYARRLVVSIPLTMNHKKDRLTNSCPETKWKCPVCQTPRSQHPFDYEPQKRSSNRMPRTPVLDRGLLGSGSLQ
ncbi:histone-lysine N-methyltransferase SETMAR [Trichonephila clavipes]|nr:histone-lysine N-methyltransferase SETMAR [Trichonephila clavipes]